MSNITKGIVVRNVSSKGAFYGEEVDQAGCILDASVDAIQGDKNFDHVTRTMFRGKYTQYATCDATKIIKAGGTIRKVALSSDANHCQIHGLTISKANNLFSNHQDW
ncbi:MAG: hypothetical protein QNK23_00430 [Crocinitomicaceae bacterium]|nr:hypothetical protein [Crocinitomicaceae bacterium]